MIRGNNILGILFANVHEEKIRELTEKKVDLLAASDLYKL